MAAASGSVERPPVGREHEFGRRAGGRREALLEHVVRVLGLDAGYVEGVVHRTADGLAQREDEDHRGDPGGEDPPAAADRKRPRRWRNTVIADEV